MSLEVLNSDARLLQKPVYSLQFQIPAPLGMIVAGIMLRNIHNGYIISGVKSSWTKEFRGIALAAIFLRSGLELDLGVKLFKPKTTLLKFNSALSAPISKILGSESD